MQKIILLSFADKRYKKTLDRLKQQTEAFPFDECFFLTQADLSKSYRKSLETWKYRRGYGYWRWKFHLVNERLKKMEQDDILFYSDAGNYWNEKGIARFNEYINMLNDATDESCILVFEEPFLEKDWTKGDAFHYFGMDSNISVQMSLQIWGGAFAIRKTQQTEQFIRELDNIYQNHKELVTDRSSVINNFYGFREHRHDQSCFSLFMKQRPHITIGWQETNTLDLISWSNLESFPIQGRRLKEKDRSASGRIKHFLSLPYRIAMCQYLIHFEHFHFSMRIPRY